MSQGRFQDQVALVTGGSSGIGRAAAMAFAREGAHVVIASRGRERGEQVEHELRALGAQALWVQCDVSDAEQVEALLRRAVERFGALHCALNNAATTETGAFRATHELTAEEWDGHLAFNLRSVWLCMKWQIRQMLDQGGGAIVNTSSVNGLGGVPNNGPYAAAKAGVIALTKSAALEYAGQGIRVNALVAGGFRTPMLENVFRTVNPDEPEAVERMFSEQVAMGRIGRPEEAAQAALWLCSDAASYVTGHSLIVDGGLTAPWR